MKTVTSQELQAGGVDQRFKADANSAYEIVGHFHPDPSGGGWLNNRGIEPLIPYDSTMVFTTSKITAALQPVRFLSVVTRHQSAEIYYLYEQNGELKYDLGNKGQNAGSRQTSILDFGRKLPKPDDCGTQLTTYGRFNLIVNGFNRMLKWWGRDLVAGFGFINPTPSPLIADIQTNYIAYKDSAVLPIPGEAYTKRLENGATAIRLPSSSYYGLGSPLEGAVNRYDYKISFITDTGSESPLSISASVNWTVSVSSFSGVGPNKPSDLKYSEGKYAVYISNFPTGPQGTVARRIWRTKNRVDGVTGAGEIYYLVTQVDNNSDSDYMDYIPDQDLNVVAPSATDSVLISSQWKYCATWNNSVWLGGSEQNPYGIIYSKGGAPEQFDAFNTFDVGLREGGAITALVPFYDVMLVFRERAIEMISYNNGGYSISTLDSNIGTTATNTIKLVAGVGIMFLSKDGIFSISGSIRGGSTYEITRMSESIEKEMGRVSLSALPRATATYSEREKEYWVHYPIDGETENSRGSVFHLQNLEWSFRYGNGISGDGNGMPYTHLASDPNGWIIIGLRPKITADLITGSRGSPGIGLQVWSASRFSGWHLTNPVVDPQGATTTYDLTSIAKEKDTWISTWTDFGDDTVKKRVMSVDLEVITTGENPITLEWATDWGYTYTLSGTQIPLKPENVGTTSTEPSYGLLGGAPAVWGTSLWSQSQVTRIRWDIGTTLISQFQFKLSSSNLFHVLSYKIEYVGSTNRVLNQNTPSSRQ
jgi:hypothetical protein